MKNAFIIKGNPKYKLSPKVTNAFYDTLKRICVKHHYKVTFFESDVVSTTLPRGSKDDVYIFFSRGVGYVKWLREDNVKSIFIGIGVQDDGRCDYVINNVNDKVNDNDFSSTSLQAHWTIDEVMVNRLNEVLSTISVGNEDYNLNKEMKMSTLDIILSGEQLAIFEDIANNPAGFVEGDFNDINIKVLVDNGLIELDENAKYSLTDVGIYYKENITDKEDDYTEEDDEDTYESLVEASDSLKRLVEVTEIDTKYASMENMGVVINNVMGDVLSGFKSFNNFLKGKLTNQLSGTTLDFNIKALERKYKDVAFINLTELRIPVPSGFVGKYVPYSETLIKAAERAFKVEAYLKSFSTFVSFVINDEDGRKQLHNNDKEYIRIADDRESMYATIGAFFSEKEHTTAKYGSLVDRHADWKDIATNTKTALNHINKVDRAKLIKDSNVLAEYLKKIKEASKRGGFNTASPEVVNTLVKGAYDVASELEYFAVISFRLMVFSETLNRDEKALMKAMTFRE